MSIIISANKAKQKVENDAAICIDVRTKVDGFKDGEAAYDDHHIENAIYLHAKRDLSGEGSFLPNAESLATTLGEHGIDETTPVIIYDEGNNRAASRAWVALTYIGHEQVYLLNGGLDAWRTVGGTLTAERPEHEPKTYRTNVRDSLLAHIDDVKEKLHNDASVLIDSRAYDRYSGKVEPKYKKAGHIPGAKNFHAKLVQAEDGKWKEKDELEKHFATLEKYDEVIVSCGSGNSACLNVVALKEAGFENVRLFAGGFSEWISDDANKVATEEE